MKVTCPRCGRDLNVSQGASGLQVRCPLCHETLIWEGTVPLAKRPHRRPLLHPFHRQFTPSGLRRPSARPSTPELLVVGVRRSGCGAGRRDLPVRRGWPFVRADLRIG